MAKLKDEEKLVTRADMAAAIAENTARTVAAVNDVFIQQGRRIGRLESAENQRAGRWYRRAWRWAKALPARVQQRRATQQVVPEAAGGK